MREYGKHATRARNNRAWCGPTLLQLCPMERWLLHLWHDDWRIHRVPNLGWRVWRRVLINLHFQFQSRQRDPRGRGGRIRLVFPWFWYACSLRLDIFHWFLEGTLARREHCLELNDHSWHHARYHHTLLCHCYQFLTTNLDRRYYAIFRCLRGLPCIPRRPFLADLVPKHLRASTKIRNNLHRYNHDLWFSVRWTCYGNFLVSIIFLEDKCKRIMVVTFRTHHLHPVPWRFPIRNFRKIQQRRGRNIHKVFRDWKSVRENRASFGGMTIRLLILNFNKL